MDKKLRKQLKSLGSKRTQYPKRPHKSILEVFDAPAPTSAADGKFFYVRFDQDGEFTSLCPVTGQPDFANIRLVYQPSKLCVESKSLKLYLASFRNYPGFGEKITNRIADDLFAVMKPMWIAVVGEFRSRGGISWTTTALRVVPSHDLNIMDVEQVSLISQRRLP